MRIGRKPRSIVRPILLCFSASFVEKQIPVALLLKIQLARSNGGRAPVKLIAKTLLKFAQRWTARTALINTDIPVDEIEQAPSLLVRAHQLHRDFLEFYLHNGVNRFSHSSGSLNGFFLCGGKLVIE